MAAAVSAAAEDKALATCAVPYLESFVDALIGRHAVPPLPPCLTLQDQTATALSQTTPEDFGGDEKLWALVRVARLFETLYKRGRQAGSVMGAEALVSAMLRARPAETSGAVGLKAAVENVKGDTMITLLGVRRAPALRAPAAHALSGAPFSFHRHLTVPLVLSCTLHTHGPPHVPLAAPVPRRFRS